MVLLCAADSELALKDVVHALGSDSPVNDDIVLMVVGHDGELVIDARFGAAWSQVAHEPGDNRSLLRLGYFKRVLACRQEVAVQAAWERQHQRAQ